MYRTRCPRCINRKSLLNICYKQDIKVQQEFQTLKLVIKLAMKLIIKLAILFPALRVARLKTITLVLGERERERIN